MINTDDGRWLTYREAAAVLGLKPEGVRSLARRRGWSRQTPNEIGGVARVLLPTGVGATVRPDRTDGVTDGATGDDRQQRDGANGESDGELSSDAPENGPFDRPGTPSGAMPVEVALLRERIADKDGVIGDLRQRLDAADRRLDAALEAQQVAADELSALRAAVDQRRAWGLLRRLYAALKGV